MSEEQQPTSGNAWGDDISEERKAELEQRLQAWEQAAEHGERRGPFDGVKLTGADVFWLAARTLAGIAEKQAVARAMDQLRHAHFGNGLRSVFNLSALHLEHANLRGAQLVQAILSQAHLEDANFTGAHLEDADLRGAHVEYAVFDEAFLELASFYEAQGNQATFFMRAHMRRANLVRSHFQSANFGGADLTDAFFALADMGQADLAFSNLAGANMPGVNLAGADLRRCKMDAGTDLSGARLGDLPHGFASIADVTWGGANISAISWSTDENTSSHGKVNRHVVLGDETLARHPPDIGHVKAGLYYDFATAVRAYRQLAAALRSQGASEQADELTYRAQVVQREVLRRQRQWGALTVSWGLAILSGYGFRLWRILASYATIVAFFALAYFLLGFFSSPHVTWYEALLASLTDIHGRVGVNTIFPLLSVQQWLAAFESIFGIVIEGVFVAMLVQRFFGSR